MRQRVRHASRWATAGAEQLSSGCLHHVSPASSERQRRAPAQAGTCCRWGENGYVSSGRMRARPVAPVPSKVGLPVLLLSSLLALCLPGCCVAATVQAAESPSCPGCRHRRARLPARQQPRRLPSRAPAALPSPPRLQRGQQGTLPQALCQSLAPARAKARARPRAPPPPCQDATGTMT